MCRRSLGIGIGSTTIKFVLVENGKVIAERYERHMAQIRQSALTILVRPLSLNVQPEIIGGVEGALHLFLDAPDADKPDENTPRVRYLGPGVRRDVMITLRRGETIYLDEGSIVYGQIFCGLGSDFTIAGHGVLCGSICDRYRDTIVPISLTDLAQSCEIGYETRAKAMTSLTFRDITVLHNFHKPVISIHNSDQAAISGVLFENIIVEDAQMGEGDGTPYGKNTGHPHLFQ